MDWRKVFWEIIFRRLRSLMFGNIIYGHNGMEWSTKSNQWKHSPRCIFNQDLKSAFGQAIKGLKDGKQNVTIALNRKREKIKRYIKPVLFLDLENERTSFFGRKAINQDLSFSMNTKKKGKSDFAILTKSFHFMYINQNITSHYRHFGNYKSLLLSLGFHHCHVHRSGNYDIPTSKSIPKNKNKYYLRLIKILKKIF